MTVSDDLCVSIIDKGPFYNLVSANSFVPDQYLFSSINCLSFKAVSFTDRAVDLNEELGKIKDSAVKFGLPLIKVSRIVNEQVDSVNSKAKILSHDDNEISS